MPNLLIGTPCYNGTVTMQYMVAMLGLQRALAADGIGFALEMTGSESLVPRARNFIVAKFLGGAHFTHLLFIDADIGFDPSLVPRYLKVAKDIVAGIYPIKRLDPEAIRGLAPGTSPAATLHYAVKLSAGEVPDADGFARADYAATGFMLIRRNVLERMAARHPELQYAHMFSHVEAAAAGSAAHLYALFDTSLDRERGLYLPEDYTFCQRWRAMGGEIWVDVRSKLTHVGTYSYEGDFSAYLNR